MKSILKFLGFTVVIMFIVITYSCDKDHHDNLNKNKCNFSNPIEELNWLKKAIEDVKEDEYSYYAMATYKGEKVFYYGNCNPAINYSSYIQNCNGDNLGGTKDLYDELIDIIIIWEHITSKCEFIEKN